MGTWGSLFRRRARADVEQRPWEELETEATSTSGEADSRPVRLGQGAHNAGFCGNSIYTAKYNLVTFLPIFLFTMFSRVAYLYFLAQASLAWWRTVSPFSPYGPTIALVFVLGVAAIKAALEDRKRHIEDRKINNSIAHVVQADGSIKDVKWKEVRVGDLLQVRDDEDIPADLVCVGCSHPDNVCFIKTTNLDGESNLKIRRPLDLRDDIPHNEAAAARLVGVLRCEPPNPNLHYFVAKFSYIASNGDGARTTIPVTMNEVLLRGCTLKNSGAATGLVVYTGPETRIQMNAAAPPRKLGSFDYFLNIQITIVILMQFLICLACSLGSLGWRSNWGYDRYYLGLNAYVQGNYQNGFVYVIILFLTFWILFSYLVPISLFVTLEIVKFILCTIYIMFDPYMRDPETRELARARNSDIVEDLGQVEYVFSDKTGTLTSNEMQMRMVAIKGLEYGSPDFRLEESVGATAVERLSAFDERLAHAASVMARTGFWAQLASSGGSSADILSLASSNPDSKTIHTTPSLQHLTAPGTGEPDLISLMSPTGTPSPPSRSPLGVSQENGSSPQAYTNPLYNRTTGQYNNSGTPGQYSDGVRSDAGSDPEAQARALVLGHHVADFWTILCICHNLIVEASPKPGKAPLFQGPSPDEVALVEAARSLGFEFQRRTRTSLTLRLMGHEVTYEVLNVLEFTSERARMSVIARAPDGTIRLYTKGSDAIMLTLLKKDSSPALIAATNDNLRMFSIQGLRTLVLGSRVVGEAEWTAWNARYQAAAASLEGREEAIAAVAAEVETGLELVGVTAIEDKLQRGVPQAIKMLIAAGIKVWMITGDKQETAINIAISCKLIQSPEGAMMCNAPASPEQAMARLAELLQETEARIMAASQQQRGLGDDEGRRELVIDGKTLSHILGTPAEDLLAALASYCPALVICRASPSQKAGIVRMMKRYSRRERIQGTKMNYDPPAPRGGAWWRKVGRFLRRNTINRLRTRGLNTRMLAIGDGANDVAMIQAADIGVGIMGKEGRQAVNNSDFAFTQFRFLTRLLLVHGTLADYRLGRLIKYSFYKNIAFAFMLFFYQFFCGFSGQALLDGLTAAFYNAFFTALPVGLFACFDRPVRYLSTLMTYPQGYNRRPPLTGREFWKTAVLLGIIHGAVVFFIPYLSLVPGTNRGVYDVWSLGKTMFIAMIGTVSLEIGLVSRFWTFPFFLAWSLSFALAFPFLILLPLLLQAFGSHDSSQLGIGNMLLSAPIFWMEIILVYAITYGSRFMERCCRWLWNPNDDMILAEIECERTKKKGALASQLELASYDSSGMVSPSESFRSSTSIRGSRV